MGGVCPASKIEARGEALKLSIICFQYSNPGFRATYGAEHVKKLYRMVKRNVTQPFKFYCITDCVLPYIDNEKILPIFLDKDLFPFTALGSWPVLSMFNPNIQKQIEGSVILKLDLDAVITGNIDSLIAKLKPGHLTGWLDISHKLLNPSFALFENGFGVKQIWNPYNERRPEVLELINDGRADKYGWDQAWINYVSRSFNYLTKESGIYHRREIANGWKLPHNARIVYFNSTHKPWHQKMQDRYRWIKDHYL